MRTHTRRSAAEKALVSHFLSPEAAQEAADAAAAAAVASGGGGGGGPLERAMAGGWLAAAETAAVVLGVCGEVVGELQQQGDTEALLRGGSLAPTLSALQVGVQPVMGCRLWVVGLCLETLSDAA